ncbi:MAG: radical SAM protein, partial [Candidatus Cloacimonetes bacterium]|nr:radical SAM protein [Candidatus Cloacimonadota bacterium]
MNILLITSAAPERSPFFTIEKRPPLGIGFLISVLRDAGHKVFFIDNYLRKSNFLETDYLVRKKIDFIGIYADTICFRDTRQVLDSLQIMRERKIWKGKIILGGPHTSVAPGTIPDYVDYIVQGEGEKAIFEVINGGKNRIIRSERIKDLDTIPMPAWDYFVSMPYDYSVEWFKEKPVFSMNTSRGCPYKCTFCSVGSIWGKKYTFFSAERIVNDIKYLIKTYNVKGIYFREDNFTINKKRVFDFCELLLRYNLKINWVCETRVDTIDLEMIKLMYRSGCRSFYFGVESGCQRILDFLKKGITLEQVDRVFRWCNEIGIRTAASFMVGVPTETKKERIHTLYYSEKIGATSKWINIFVGIPKGELYDYVVKNSLHEYVDDRGLIYLRGHNQLVDEIYGGNEKAKVPQDKNRKGYVIIDDQLKWIDNSSPKVSIVMSVHASAQYLKESIDSILNQTYKDFEFLVVNDGSSKSIQDVINTYSDSRLVTLDQPWIGLTKSLNNAIEYSRGKYIARMDAGDISLPNRIQKQVTILKNNLKIGLVGTSYKEISETGKKISETILSADNLKLKEGLLFQNKFCHGAVMFRCKCLEKVGLYREDFKRAQDYDLWLRIAEHFDITNIPEILYIRRVEKDSISFALKHEQNFYATLARECTEARRKGEKEPLHKLQRLKRLKSHNKWVPDLDEKRKQFYYNFHRGRS